MNPFRFHYIFIYIYLQSLHCMNPWNFCPRKSCDRQFRQVQHHHTFADIADLSKWEHLPSEALMVEGHLTEK